MQVWELTIDNKKIADKLNRYFASVFTVEDTCNIPAIAINQKLEEWMNSGKAINRAGN